MRCKAAWLAFDTAIEVVEFGRGLAAPLSQQRRWEQQRLVKLERLAGGDWPGNNDWCMPKAWTALPREAYSDPEEETGSVAVPAQAVLVQRLDGRADIISQGEMRWRSVVRWLQGNIACCATE